MKTLKWLLSFICISLVFGCSINGDENAKAKIQGKWFLIKQVELEYQDDKLTKEFKDIDFTDENYMEFKSNGKVTLSRQGSHEVADYSINQTGTQLTLSRANGTSSVDHIKSLTSTELIFREEDSEVVDGTACRYVAEFYLRKGKQ